MARQGKVLWPKLLELSLNFPSTNHCLTQSHQDRLEILSQQSLFVGQGMHYNMPIYKMSWLVGWRFTRGKNSSRDHYLPQVRVQNSAGRAWWFVICATTDWFDAYFLAFSLFLNLFLQGMAVFATPSWPSPISGLPHFPVRYLGERCASTTAKTKYLLYEINLPICTYSGDFWWRDSWTASPSPSSSAPVNQHHEGLLWSFTSLQPGYQYQMIHITLILVVF